MTLTELRWHAGCASPLHEPIAIEAQVTAVGPAVVTRWVPDCSAPAGRAVDVVITASTTDDGKELRPGMWVRAVGTLVAGSGADFEGHPELDTAAGTVRVVDDAPPRYEIDW